MCSFRGRLWSLARVIDVNADVKLATCFQKMDEIELDLRSQYQGYLLTWFFPKQLPRKAEMHDTGKGIYY